jgi:hypothetical protein
MTDIPPYLLPRPPVDLGPALRADFDRLFDDAVASRPASPIDYRLPAPRWQFICHIADTRNVIVHGSSNLNIWTFEPRKSDDVHEFGNRAAVYGSSDGLWAMFYAVLDRPRTPMSISNAAVRIEDDHGTLGPPYYFFSMSNPALAARAFGPGSIYLLPRDTFEPMRVQDIGGRRVHVPQWASLEAVTPLARIDVAPDDFPLLGAIRGHDDETMFARARANPAGFPWLDE